ncbi:aldo/keto reductase [Leuconostoc falkenbergense]|uniref:aldo/keto reductase n=1 Tax=Leuconostoc falkenbergense TaxID=2766470 RepID=UPI0024AD8505|nr:aldo/keto reductase [Leuconostoc falkenbergense]MDI6666711.1 aldo/keto reductase [Leuconostoc falkenbergense]
MTDVYDLNNGIKIPKVGFGTWLIEKDSDAEQAVRSAIQAGYRHIDTAEAYGNEIGVGRGVRESGINRQDIFITTKLRAEIKNYEEAVKAINESLQKLDLEYIDLMIIHSPKPWAEFHGKNHYFEGNLAAWQALEEAYQAGKVKAIGVSNFEKVDLENILEHGQIKPMVNQILAHIGNTPFDLIKFTQQQKIVVEAYSPFGHGDMFQNQEIQSMADKYSVSISQLAIKYLLQLNLLPLPKAATQVHMVDNTKLDFSINPADMKILAQFDHTHYSEDNQMFPVYHD